jgi:DNA-binding MarR family transcriptional regulator
VRLTDRRLEVLRVVWLAPGLSNRGVGEATGVGQAQMSRMLRRLADLGLVQNTGGGRRLGMANCWHLTAAGRELLQVGGRSRPTGGTTDGR